jgi:hypothetical protein
MDSGLDRAAIVALGLHYLQEADALIQAAGVTPGAEGAAG